MVPIVTPEEMGAIDAAAPEPVEVLIERAGAAVARAARRLLGGTYGRRVVVLAGKGNNGADGRAAARRLQRWGVHVQVFEAAAPPATVPPCDLVIDAAYGTGFRGTWEPPDVGDAPVLAVDLPSGVDGLTGAVPGRVLRADVTVTFAALKPGLLLPPGRGLSGDVEIADIGLDVSRARCHLVTPADVVSWLPAREATDHKWRAALWCVAGSPGMLGSAHLAATAALRAGAGMVRLSTPGVTYDPMLPTEAVGRALNSGSWTQEVLSDDDRFHAFVVGPGLGRTDEAAESIRQFVGRAHRPVLVDGDGLFALAWSRDGAASLVRPRLHPTVLTPHDGEYALLKGTRVGPDRIGAARDLSSELDAVVVLKGAATVVAEPSGAARVVAEGDARLATAGTGDVLSGVIGAFLAQGLAPFDAAAAGAWVHGRAGRLGPQRGLVAGDLPRLVALVLSELAP